MSKSIFNKIKRGEPLLASILSLKRGDTLLVPYRFYSEPTIKNMASKIKIDYGIVLRGSYSSNIHAVLIREE